MKLELIPALLVQSEADARNALDSLPKNIRWIQLDVLDGTFAPNHSWADPTIIKRWKKFPRIELDLMVDDPRALLQTWHRVPQIGRVLWHVECQIDHSTLIAWCKRQGWQVGLSLNPETPLAAVAPFLNEIDCILFLGVHPGFSGQKLIPSILSKVRALRHFSSRLPIALDGGITLRNACSLLQAGVTRLCVNSAIFKVSDPKKAIQKFHELLA